MDGSTASSSRPNGEPAPLSMVEVHAHSIDTNKESRGSSVIFPGMPPDIEHLLPLQPSPARPQRYASNVSVGSTGQQQSLPALREENLRNLPGPTSPGRSLRHAKEAPTLPLPVPSPEREPVMMPPRRGGSYVSDRSSVTPASQLRPGLVKRTSYGSKLCLQEQEGDYSMIRVMPPEREESTATPWLRFSDVLRYLQSLFCPPSLAEAVCRALWRPLAGFLWFLSLIMWQVLFGLLVSALAVYAIPHLNRLEEKKGHYDIHGEYQSTHKTFGAILGFVIAFRTNNAYNLYYEGRRIVANLISAAREIVLEAYTSLPKGTPGPTFSDGRVVPGGPSNVNEHTIAEEERYLKATAQEIRRLCMMTLAFIRQDVRESKCGFLKGTDLEDVPFRAQTNFYMDPVRPRLWDMLTDEELTMYYALPSRVRPGVCVGEMKRHIELMCLRLEKGESVFVRVVTPHVQMLLNSHEAMIRIRDTPMPFPVLYVLYVSCFVFVYSTPFLFQTDTVGTFLCVQLLVVIYYGLLKIADAIENPFRYASGGFSLPLEKYVKRVHNDTLAYARMLAGDDRSFIPAHLEPPPTDALLHHKTK